MATQFIQLSGKAKWAKVKPSQLDEQYNNWSICLYLNRDSMDKYMKSGLRLNFKEDEDGKYLTLRRPAEKRFGNDVVEFDPPGVWKDGQAYTGTIGNGSQVTCKIEVYDTSRGKGHRLDGVRIDELVEFKSENTEGGKRVAMPF